MKKVVKQTRRPKQTPASKPAHEVASLHIKTVNDLIDRLRKLHNLTGLVILGETVDRGPQTGHDGFNIYIATLSMDQGVGAAIVDMEDVLCATQSPDALKDMVRPRFVPFDQLSPQHKILVHEKTGDLLSRMFKHLPLAI